MMETENGQGGVVNLGGLESENVMEVCKIVGGAPSRGALGIDRTDHIRIGQWMQVRISS